MHTVASITGDIQNLLTVFLRELQICLGAELLGVYVYGSAVAGDFDESISDADLFVVTTTEMDNSRFSALHRLHTQLLQEFPYWNNRIDIAYFSADALENIKSQNVKLAVISPGEAFNQKEAHPGWRMNCYNVCHKGVTLFGPAPCELFPSITQEEFIAIVRNQVSEWCEWISCEDWPRRLGAQAYAILTMCRAFYVCTKGEQVSKQQAAAWTQKELPEKAALIQRALEWRASKDNARADEAAFVDAKEFVFYIHSLCGEQND